MICHLNERYSSIIIIISKIKKQRNTAMVTKYRLLDVTTNQKMIFICFCMKVNEKGHN